MSTRRCCRNCAELRRFSGRSCVGTSAPVLPPCASTRGLTRRHLSQWDTPIGPDETAPELSLRLAEAGARLLIETLFELAAGSAHPVPQDNALATLAPILKKEDGRIDWHCSAQQIHNRIRGLQPWPGAHTSFRGQSLHLWRSRLVPQRWNLAPERWYTRRAFSPWAETEPRWSYSKFNSKAERRCRRGVR